MSASRRTGARATRRLKFVCTDNVNTKYGYDQVLLVWDSGSFALLHDGPNGFDFVEHADYRILTKLDWEERGWGTVVEL